MASSLISIESPPRPVFCNKKNLQHSLQKEIFYDFSISLGETKSKVSLPSDSMADSFLDLIEVFDFFELDLICLPTNHNPVSISNALDLFR